MSPTDVYEYRVGDAFYNPHLTSSQNVPIRKSVVNNYPDSILGSYLSKTKENVKTLSKFMKKSCSTTTSLDGHDCLVALRTGDVLSNIEVQNLEKKLPRSPEFIARNVEKAHCANTLFVTGKHGIGRTSGDRETDAFLRDLGAEMDARSLKHDIKLTKNNTSDDVDKDMCAMATFKGQFFAGSGGFHKLISEIRGGDELQSLSVFEGGHTGDPICYSENNKYRHLC